MPEAIDYFAYNNPLLRIKTFFSLKARRKMYRKFMEYCKPSESDNVLDLGATPDTRLADSNFFEMLYPWKQNITVASIENCSALVEKLGLKAYVYNEPKKASHLLIRNLIFCFALLFWSMLEQERIRNTFLRNV